MTKQQWVNDWCPDKKRSGNAETQIRGDVNGEMSDTSTSKETPSVEEAAGREEARKDAHLWGFRREHGPPDDLISDI